MAEPEGAPEAVDQRGQTAAECERLVSLDASGLYTADSQYSMAASARHLSHKQQLGLTGLVCLIFLEVAGGPFGTEVQFHSAL
jgi:hypothetical protein